MGLTNRRPVATIGVEDIIIVDTDADLLVMHKDRVQEVKSKSYFLRSAARRTT